MHLYRDAHWQPRPRVDTPERCTPRLVGRRPLARRHRASRQSSAGHRRRSARGASTRPRTCHRRDRHGFDRARRRRRSTRRVSTIPAAGDAVFRRRVLGVLVAASRAERTRASSRQAWSALAVTFREPEPLWGEPTQLFVPRAFLWQRAGRLAKAPPSPLFQWLLPPGSAAGAALQETPED